MKARLPKNYNPGAANIQQLARQAQKMQEEMDAATTELEEKEYSATSVGEGVTVTVTGKMEVKSIEIKPEEASGDRKKNRPAACLPCFAAAKERG